MNQKRQAWAVVIVVVLAGLVTTVNQFKVPPALPSLSAELGLDAVAGGWLMSVFSVAAILLSIPAALALPRLGFRAMGAVALGCLAAGSLLGALARGAPLLVLSRLIEGISFALMAVVAPALISRWFQPDDLGLPMGIWAAWVPAGNVISFNLAPVLERALGWRSIWWFGALLALASLALYALIARPPRPPAGCDAAEPLPPGPGRTSGPLAALRGLFSPGNWLLGLAFGSFAAALISYSAWAPTFLSGEIGVARAAASFYASLLSLSAVLANLLAGWLINRLGRGHALLVAAFAIITVLYWWSFRLSGVGAVVPYMLAVGFVSNLVPTAAFTLAPKTVRRPDLAGLAMAVLNVVSNVGIFIGPPLLGAVVGRGQWDLAAGMLVGVSVVGLVASLFAWRLAARSPNPRPAL